MAAGPCTSTGPITRPITGPIHGHLVGEPAPAFAGVDTHGAALTSASLRAGTTLLAFFPLAFTGVCGDELGELSAAAEPGGALAGFAECAGPAGLRVLAVSCDPMASQRAWREQRGFGFELVSDFWPHGRIAHAFGVFDETSGRAERASFLIDSAGTVRWSLVHPAGLPRPVSAYADALAGLARPGRD
ncbi:redoxin domain-containing protein [Pseudactinotalea sp. HY160]|uniref:redoxin domain-containing protein n=1 Tax=Pseudactinotalea sp. HY160 TaxID=2654490 RepID=UPI00351BBB77